MKRSLFLLVATGLLLFSLPAHATTTPPTEPSPTTTAATPSITINDFLKLSPREFQQRTGKKLKFKERIAYRVLQWKLRKHFREQDEPTAKQLKQGNLSLVFGIAAIVFLFIPVVGILSLGFAIAGLVLGIKSLKGNSNTTGLIGLILSGLVLFLFLLAVIVLTSIDWI
jgi:hypothetical protein